MTEPLSEGFVDYVTFQVGPIVVMEVFIINLHQHPIRPRKGETGQARALIQCELLYGWVPSMKCWSGVITFFHLVHSTSTTWTFRPPPPPPLSRSLILLVEKTKLRSAKQWQCITRLINKSETMVMVSRLIPHCSSNILLCSYFCPSSVNYSLCSYSYPSSVDSFTVFSFPSVFCRFLI